MEEKNQGKRLFTIASNNNNKKNLKVTLTMKVKGLYDRNLKSLKKKIEENLRTCKDLP